MYIRQKHPDGLTHIVGVGVVQSKYYEATTLRHTEKADRYAAVISLGLHSREDGTIYDEKAIITLYVTEKNKLKKRYEPVMRSLKSGDQIIFFGVLRRKQPEHFSFEAFIEFICRTSDIISLNQYVEHGVRELRAGDSGVYDPDEIPFD